MGAPEPGRVIASSAFDYAVQFWRYADTKYPELKGYAADVRHAAVQAAIVVATLRQLEKKTPGAGGAEMRAKVGAAYPSAARRRCEGAVDDLTEHLSPMKNPADDALKTAIGVWIVASLKQREPDPADAATAAAIGRSAWTSGVMIVRKLQRP
jgi:hypothetical protein